MRKISNKASLLLVLPLMMCATPQCAVSDFCQKYTPVYTSPRDTESTRKQNDVNNAQYDKDCAEDPVE